MSTALMPELRVSCNQIIDRVQKLGRYIDAVAERSGRSSRKRLITCFYEHCEITRGEATYLIDLFELADA